MNKNQLNAVAILGVLAALLSAATISMQSAMAIGPKQEDFIAAKVPGWLYQTQGGCGDLEVDCESNGASGLTPGSHHRDEGLGRGGLSDFAPGRYLGGNIDPCPQCD